MKRNKKECPKCGKFISLSNLERHIDSHGCKKNRTDNERLQKDGKYKCPYCGKNFCKRGLGPHIWRKHTEDGKKFKPCLSKLGKPSWNKGLTKFTDERVARGAQTYKERLDKCEIKHPWKGREFTKEHKENCSKSRKDFLAQNPEMHPNLLLANNRAKWTYPEKLAAEWFEAKGINYGYNKKILSYYPDFLLDDNIIIEIDGERWHSSPKAIKYDKQRDEQLEKEGYVVYRIPAKDVIVSLEKFFANRGVV